MDRPLAFFSPSLTGGGSERVMLNIANGCAARGYDVDVVLVTGKGDFLDDLDSRIQIVNLQKKRVITSVFSLMKYLRKRRPASLLSTQLHSNVVALIAAALSGARVKVVVREVTSPNREKARRQTPISITLSFLARRLYRRAYCVISVCNDMKPQIASNRMVGMDKIKVIYNPIRIGEIRSLAKDATIYDWLDSNQTATIVAIGRLERVKDFETLIRAFKIVRDQKQAKLVILGEGSLRPQLTSLAGELAIAEDVYLPGFVENPYAYLGRANVVVLSSKWEGLPNVLLEALALDIPIVSTDCQTGPREILRDGRDGTLVPVGDADGLARGIIDTLTDTSRRANDPESVGRFEFDSVVQQYIDVMCH